MVEVNTKNGGYTWKLSGDLAVVQVGEKMIEVNTKNGEYTWNLSGDLAVVQVLTDKGKDMNVKQHTMGSCPDPFCTAFILGRSTCDMVRDIADHGDVPRSRMLETFLKGFEEEARRRIEEGESDEGKADNQ